MNLTEQYPLDVTKAGDSVKSAILKNRSEILGVMDSLNDQPAGSVGDARNRVLSAHMVNNVYNFLSSDGLTVAIDGSIEPVLLTFSDEDRMCKEVLFEGSMDECKLFIQSRGYYCQLLEKNSI